MQLIDGRKNFFDRADINLAEIRPGTLSKCQEPSKCQKSIE